jgi:hypothetical protein
MVDATRNRPTFSRLAWVVALAICSGSTALTVSVAGNVPSSSTATNHANEAVRHVVGNAGRPVTSPTDPTASEVRPSADSATPVAASVPSGHALAPVAAAPLGDPATDTTLPALVADVEASGIDPGSNWNWSVGSTSTYCGPISGAGTGCTYGEAGLEHTIFAGMPTLALVAHELANAETQNDAVPSLLHEVATAAGGTSWSPTDAVASCLVEHFMGFQDDAAGIWQCPAALATVVAENIHDTY